MGAHSAIVGEALGLGPRIAAQLPALQRVLATAWELHWDNVRKELIWRLAVDGFQYHAGMHHPPYYSFQTHAFAVLLPLRGNGWIG